MSAVVSSPASCAREMPDFSSLTIVEKSAIVAATGHVYSGLWYPFAVTLISVVVCLLLLPETRGRSLDQ